MTVARTAPNDGADDHPGAIAVSHGDTLPKPKSGQRRPLACSDGITLRGNQARLRLPPQAAPAGGRPEGADAPMNQSREAHHTARPHHSPEGGQH